MMGCGRKWEMGSRSYKCVGCGISERWILKNGGSLAPETGGIWKVVVDRTDNDRHFLELIYLLLPVTDWALKTAVGPRGASHAVG